MTSARPSARACSFGLLEGFHRMEKRLSVDKSCTVYAIAKLVQPYGRNTRGDLYNLELQVFEDGFQLSANPSPF
jgi:hypothetical protein